MAVRIVPDICPDFAVSRWLAFGGGGKVPGDPALASQFASAYLFLDAITHYFTEAAGPWFAATAQYLGEIHDDYLHWCRFVTNRQAAPYGNRFVPFTLNNLMALSTRRMRALAEFGGYQREDYPIYFHLHRITLAAAGRRRHRHANMNGTQTADVTETTSGEERWCRPASHAYLTGKSTAKMK